MKKEFVCSLFQRAVLLDLCLITKTLFQQFNDKGCSVPLLMSGKSHLPFLLRLHLRCYGRTSRILGKSHLFSVMIHHLMCYCARLLILGMSHVPSVLILHLTCCNIALLISRKFHVAVLYNMDFINHIPKRDHISWRCRSQLLH